MAVTILGSGTTPVTGTREFDVIPGGSPAESGTSGVTILSGDTNNYVMTSTGVGDELQGESNLQFNGTTLTVTGNIVINSGGITIDTISPSGASANVVIYNPVSGALNYNAGGGGGTTFLRDDGTWSTPAGAGDVSKVGSPANDELGVWTGDGTIEGDSNLTINASTFTLGGNRDFNISNGDIYLPNATAYSTGNAAILHWDSALGQIQVNASGGGTANFLRADGSWAAPSGSFTGSGANQQVAVWSGASSLTGSSNLTLSATDLTIGGTIDVTISEGDLTVSDGDVILPTIPTEFSLTSGIRLVTWDSSDNKLGVIEGEDTNDLFLSSQGSWKEVVEPDTNRESNDPEAGWMPVWTSDSEIKGVPGMTFSEGELTNILDINEKITEVTITGPVLISSGSLNQTTTTANSYLINDTDTYEISIRGSHSSTSSKIWENSGNAGIKGYNAVSYSDANGYAEVYVNGDEIVIQTYDTSNYRSITINDTSISISGLPTYSDNLAAVAGGLSTGDLYQTGSGVLMITV